MRHVMLVIRDVKSDVFGRPFFAKTEGEAVRTFEDTINDANPNNLMHKHPEDFALFTVGTFDDTEAVFVTHIPKILIEGIQVKRQEDRNA